VLPWGQPPPPGLTLTWPALETQSATLSDPAALAGAFSARVTAPALPPSATKIAAPATIVA
jgi:hypothetical protein